MAPPAAIDVRDADDTHAATVIEPLAINGVPARRATGPPMARGVAPFTHSDMFKGPVSRPPCIALVRLSTQELHSNATNLRLEDGTVSHIPFPAILKLRRFRHLESRGESKKS